MKFIMVMTIFVGLTSSALSSDRELSSDFYGSDTIDFWILETESK